MTPPARKAASPQWAEPLVAYLTWLSAAGLAEGTIRTRERQLRCLSEVAGDPWLVTSVQLAAWISNPGWKPNTARSHRATICGFYRWAQRHGWIEHDPTTVLDSVLVPRSLPRPMPDGPLREALAAANDHVRLAIAFGALAGLRRAEIAGLHASQISGTEILVVGKGGHERRVPMHPVLWELVEPHLNLGSGPDRYLFPSRGRRPVSPAGLGKRMRRVLPRPWTPHALRHRFATMAYAQQRDLLAVQRLLGHVKPESTAGYAQVPDGALRSAVLGLTL